MVPSQKAATQGQAVRRTSRWRRVTPPTGVGRSWLGNLKIGQKLILISLAFVLPIAVVVGLLVGEQNRAINTTLKEQRGLEYLVLLRQLMQDIQLHRGRAATQLGGDPTARQPRLELAAKINRDFGALSELDQRYKAEFGVSGALSDLRLGWENLVQNLDQLSPQESTQRHDELINRGILGIMETVGNASGLAVDAEQASAYLSRLAIRDLPAAINATGLVRTLGITAASRGVNDEGQKPSCACGWRWLRRT